ncbi:MAG: TlpA family protein disulfide reductase [Caldilineaceae bacterium]|nr:TlpA family protein disulfide reductase [Caldilineaceae bacterium]
MAELSNMETNPQSNGASALEETATNPAQQRSVMLWRFIIVAVAVVFVAILAWRLVQTNTSEHRADGTAPPLTFTTFEGETISLDDLRGQGVVINFWASWCDPCRDEADLLEQTWLREKDNGIVFLGLDYLDQEPAAKAYLAEFNVTYPNGPDLRSEIARRYGIKGVPETFFINPQGEIADIVIGPITGQAQMDRLLSQIRPTQ